MIDHIIVLGKFEFMEFVAQHYHFLYADDLKLDTLLISLISTDDSHNLQVLSNLLVWSRI